MVSKVDYTYDGLLQGLLRRPWGGQSDSITEKTFRLEWSHQGLLGGLLGRLLGGHSDGITEEASRLEWLQLKKLVMDLMMGAEMPTGC